MQGPRGPGVPSEVFTTLLVLPILELVATRATYAHIRCALMHIACRHSELAEGDDSRPPRQAMSRCEALPSLCSLAAGSAQRPTGPKRANHSA